jgi:hypothetical protein
VPPDVESGSADRGIPGSSKGESPKRKTGEEEAEEKDEDGDEGESEEGEDEDEEGGEEGEWGRGGRRARAIRRTRRWARKRTRRRAMGVGTRCRISRAAWTRRARLPGPLVRPRRKD